MMPYNDSQKLQLLLNKGGMMFFTIVRPQRIFRGVVVLSAVKDQCRNRDVFIKEYKCNLQLISSKEGKNETHAS